MVDYSKLSIEETEDFTTSRGRGADNPIYPIFEQALADGKPRAIKGLSIKDKSDGDSGLSEFLRVARDCASAAQKLKRLNDGKGKIEASVKKEVVDGMGVVRFKAKWLERYETDQNGETTEDDGYVAEGAAATPDDAEAPNPTVRGRRRATA